jgi:outer membrane receptor protein involved in Fe transport
VDPGALLPLSGDSDIEPDIMQEESGLEYAVYLSDEWTVNEQFTLSAGIRFSGFSALGPREVINYESGLPRSTSTITDTTSVESGSFQSYAGPEYRFTARYSLSNANSIKLGVNRTRQYIHILSNNVSIAPTNTWKLSDTHIRPQIADQISLGYFHNLLGENIETSVEVYYKKFQNLLDYKTGAQLLLNPLIETDALQGEGFAYGVEFLIKRKVGRLNGWMGYTYSRSKQRFQSEFEEETINEGSYFPTNFDKPHVFNLVANYKLTRRYSFSLNVNYSTGRPITYPTGKYVLGGSEIVQYSDRNQFRLPDYFRIDLGLNIEGNHKIRKLAHGFWTISVYNLLGRDNVYSIFFVPEEGAIRGYQLSVFAEPIPTITYNFKF